MYILIESIPLEFHTPDLRNFFSYAIETETFLIFNYRHRPHSTKKFNICICKIKANKFDELVKLYDKKNWINSSGLIQLTKCSIVKIKSTNKKTSLSSADDTLSVLNEEEIHKLLEFRNIPKWMPNGNVGTPTKVFVEYINQCIMPQSLISRLGINLKTFKKHKKKKYSSVQYNYGKKEEDDDDFYYYYETDTNQEQLGNYVNIASTANGDKIQDELDDEKKIKEINYSKICQDKDDVLQNDRDNLIANESDDDGNEVEEWDRAETFNDDITKQDRTSPYFFENEIELKWEKGGSGLVFYTDENFWKEHEDKDFDAETADDLDIDTSVYYETNAGDKDARDLIEMSREQMMRNGADVKQFDDEKRDSKFKMNPFKRSEGESSLKLGSFEKYTKGFGRRQLEKSGWKEGDPVGNPTRQGLREALDGSDGKCDPRDKTGLGYHGEKVDKEKLIQFNKNKRLKEHRDSPYYIATKFDLNPSKSDNLLRRFYPTNKYRSSDKAND